MNKGIETIQELIDHLEKIIDDYTDRDDRREIIKIIEFCQRQNDLGRSLNDITYWLMKNVWIWEDEDEPQ